MPQFRFRASDAEGKVRNGRLTAANRSDAQTRVEQSGLTVLDLQEIAGELLIASNTPGCDLHPERVGPYRQVQALTERISDQLPAGFSGYRLAALMGIIGVLWGLASWRSGRTAVVPEKARGPEAMASKLFEGSISGDVSFPPGCDLSKGTLTLTFPEIPCQFSAPWADTRSNTPSEDNQLTHPQVNQFLWKLKFLAAKSPTRCEVQLVAPGFKLSQPATIVLGTSNQVYLALVPGVNQEPKLETRQRQTTR